MEANSRSVLAGPAEEADVGETLPSFEEFYEVTSRPLFTALCLVTGNRQEAEEIARTPSFACSSDGTTSGGSRIRPVTCSGSR
jgi:hypothetical protein